MTNKILPCPFCGREPVKIRTGMNENYGYAAKVVYCCEGCGASKGAIGDYSKGGYADNSTVEERALAKWNERAPLSPAHSGGGAGMVLPERDALHDLIAEVIGGDTYDCVRVWSAWGVGTMSEDDFVPFVDQDERLYELADALLDKVKELNQ